jgi:alpha-tubulin suppressor-like RCC1 family protein
VKVKLALLAGAAALLALAVPATAPAAFSNKGWAMGFNRGSGLGICEGKEAAFPKPREMCIISNFNELADGDGPGLALLENGSVDYWGGNKGHPEPFSPPFEGVTRISVHNNHEIALKSNGTVWTRGTNIYGELGVGTSCKEGHDHSEEFCNCPPGEYASAGCVWNSKAWMQVGYPTVREPITTATYVAAVGANDFAVLSNGKVLGWGPNNNSQLSPGGKTKEVKSSPISIEGITNPKQISGGGEAEVGGSILALRQDGSVIARGKNDQGQLCDGTTEDRREAWVVDKGLSNIAEISGYLSNDLFLTKGGVVYGCGSNEWGELAVSAVGPEKCIVHRGGKEVEVPCSRNPVEMPGVNGNATEVSAGEHFSFVREHYFTLSMAFGAGLNTYGQLGDGSEYSKEKLTQVPKLENVRMIRAGRYETMIGVSNEPATTEIETP